MSTINYDLTKIKAFVFDIDGVLSPSTVPLSNNGEPIRMINIKDCYALQYAIKKGYLISIISGGFSESINVNLHSLGVKDVFMRISSKLPKLKEWIIDNNLSADEVAYMGDDIPDLPALHYVGLPCAPYDATWEVKQSSKWISKFNGGYGCVRNLIEQVMKANGDWLRDECAYGW